MSQQKDKAEIERLRRKQLNQRDPGESKIRGYDWSKHDKRSKEVRARNKKPLLVEVIEALPGRWRGMFNGLLFMGVLSAFLAIVVLPSDWDFLVLIPLLMGAAVGFIVGKATETGLP